MDDEQQFNLRWHNHQNNVISALTRMYRAGVLTDVTLSANGSTVRAHRLVLASCSQYFAQLFKEVEGDNTLVIVLGCEPTELRLLLSFMYTGEVTASKKTLPSLLRLARALKVAGLTDADCSNPTTSPMETERQDENNETENPINLETIKTDTPIYSPLEAANFRFNFEDYSNNNNFDSNMSVIEGLNNAANNDERLSRLDKIVQNLYSTHKIDSPLPKVPVTTANPNHYEDRPTPYERKFRDGSVCTICSKRLSNQYNLRVHMETHSGARHACNACSHVSRSRDALRKHVAYRHPDKNTNRTLDKTD